MAKLPDPTGMARRIPGGQRTVAAIDGSAMGRAVSGFGGQLSAAGEEQAKKQDRLDLSKAKTKWLKARMEAEIELNGDKEFSTMDERYRAGLSMQVDDIGAGIRNSELKEQFRLQQEQDMEAGSARVRNKAWGVEVDHEKGELSTDLTSLRQAALTMNAQEGIELMQERIDSTSENGYLSDLEAKQMMQKSAQDYAVSKIEMSPASARAQMLKGPLGKYVPADIAKDIADKAKVENADNEAMVTADLWVAQGLDLKEGMNEAKKIKDPELRKATEQRFDLQYKTEKRATTDRQNETYQGYGDQIENGEISYDAIPREDRDLMTVVQTENLKALYAQKATGSKVKTDLAVYDSLNELLANGEPTKARQLYLDNYSRLSETDRKTYSKITTKAMGESSELDSFFTNKEYLTRAAKDAGVGDSDKRVLDARFDSWYMLYQEENEGRTPPDKEAQIAADDLLSKRPDSGVFYDDLMFEKEGSAAEIMINSRIRAVLSKENKANVAKVSAAFVKAKGREPKLKELAAHYFSNKKKGKFNGD